MDQYNIWLESTALTQAEKDELVSLDEKERFERFYTTLAFGTAGIRGTLGMGTNKMNRFIVGKTTQALCDTLKAALPGKEISVVIGYDSRHFSVEFSRLCAEILASNGIKALIFEELCPTPLVSFAIRHYGADAGINITASHNPKEYNGYKVYMANGAQLDNEMAAQVETRMGDLDNLATYNTVSFQEGLDGGLIRLLADETNNAFMKESLAQTTDVICDDFSVVYSPLFGTGRILAPLALKEVGVKNVYLVEEQMVVDGAFPGLPKGPNPEEMGSYVAALAIAQEKNADLMVVTDPDADRIGVRARNKAGEFVHFTGNMTGCLLVDYLIKRGNLPANPMVVKSIVTSQLVDFICKKHNVACHSTFTGFRFIAELIDSKPEMTAIIGLEESYGYLVGDFARDKDAITATALVCQMAMYYKNKGMTLVDALEALYAEYGYNLEETLSYTLAGSEGAVRMAEIMDGLHKNPIRSICDITVKQIRYFKDGYIYDFEKYTKMDMEGSDVVIFDLEDETQLIIRPSGTEPKVKVYILTKAETMEKAEEKVANFKVFANQLFQ